MIGEVLAGIAAQKIGSEMSQSYVDKNRQADFENWRLAREQNFNDSQRAQFNAPLNTKLGMMYAGLNPVDASASITPASSQAAPQAQHEMKPLEIAQSTNLMADAKLKEQQAEKVELENDVTKGENEGASNTYKTIAPTLVDALKTAGFTQAADSLQYDLDTVMDKKLNVGHLRGAVESYKTLTALQQRIQDTYDKVFQTKEIQYKLNNDAAKELAEMPKLQKELTIRYISTQQALAEYYLTGADVNQQQLENMNAEIHKINSEIYSNLKKGYLSEAQADAIRNSDWKTLLYDGEFVKSMVAGGEKLGSAAFEAGSDLARTLIMANSIKNGKGGKPSPRSIGQGSSLPSEPKIQGKTYTEHKLDRANPNAGKKSTGQRGSYVDDRKDIVRKKHKFDTLFDDPMFDNPDW